MKNSNLPRLGNALILILLLYSILVAIKLPIYPDEVAYKIFIERYFYSGGYKQSLTPYCANGFLVKPPIVLLPASIFGSALTLLGSEWWSYRLAPLLCFVLIVSILVYINVTSIKRVPWLILSILIITPCLYGLVILRPEIFILFSGLLLYLTGLVFVSKSDHDYLKVILLIGSIFIYSFVAYIHPKSLYLLPLLLLVIVYGVTNINNMLIKVFLVVILGALCIYISLSAIELHRIQYLNCAEIENIEKVMKKQSINILELFHDPFNFFNTIILNLNLDMLQRSISQFMFKKHFDASYLPPIENNNIFLLIINIINLLILFFSMISVIVFNLVGWKYLPVRNFLLFSVLSVGYLMPYFLNLSKNWYENSFLLGALVILLALLNPYFQNNLKIILWLHNRFLNIVVKLILVVSILASSYIVNKYFTSAFNNGYVGPGISISYDRTTLKTTIMKLIENNSLNNEIGFIADDLTYEYLKNRKIIIPATYLSLAGNEPKIVNHTLDNIGISFGITRCITLTYVHPNLKWSILESYLDPASKEMFCLFKA